MYVFDTSPLWALFKNYYRRRFPTLWGQFDALVAGGSIVSTREVLREINDCPVPSLRDWSAGQQALFPAPTGSEGEAVAQIFAVQHFQQNIEQQKLLAGGHNADPFVIARAMTEERTVVTMEILRPSAAKIPNICQHFHVPCIGLEDFMEAEGWEF
jgi:Domain of unknown function (DUF4411)